ncbi:permease-like cell division protein FtsX [Bacteroidales bacterium]|nr:permease-like cell division protein FtsX [Bacteroidales bacterium]
MTKNDQTSTLFRLRSSYISSMISISLVLFLIGMVGILIVNAKKVSDYVKENLGFSVIVEEQVKEVDIYRLQKTLDTRKYVKSTAYISKEKAAIELQEELGEDFIDFLGYNPLPISIDVKLNALYANPDSIAGIEEDLKRFGEIKEVIYQKSMVELINNNVKKISFVILSFTAILLLIAVVLINNTIRLSVYSKRFIIHTMQLVGATNSFVRQPFLLKSLFNGALGGLIATCGLIGLLLLMQQQLIEFSNLIDLQVLAFVSCTITLVGILVNGISTFFAVNKFLNINIDKLYY